MQLPLDHQVEMRDRAVCHQRRNGRRSRYFPQCLAMRLKPEHRSVYTVLTVMCHTLDLAWPKSPQTIYYSVCDVYDPFLLFNS